MSLVPRSAVVVRLGMSLTRKLGLWRCRMRLVRRAFGTN
eukprot:COSAG04_NODE_2208_length_4527_cov_1.984643_5_plen_39_part_00